jgi:hypothetical protein
MDRPQVATDSLTQGLFLLSVKQASVCEVFERRYYVFIGVLMEMRRTVLKGPGILARWFPSSMREPVQYHPLSETFCFALQIPHF